MRNKERNGNVEMRVINWDYFMEWVELVIYEYE